MVVMDIFFNVIINELLNEGCAYCLRVCELVRSRPLGACRLVGLTSDRAC